MTQLTYRTLKENHKSSEVCISEYYYYYCVYYHGCTSCGQFCLYNVRLTHSVVTCMCFCSMILGFKEEGLYALSFGAGPLSYWWCLVQ